MKRAALSPTAFTLPPSPSVQLEIVKGRQAVARHGVFFTAVGKHRRGVYQQMNREIILADECKCTVEWLAWTGRETGASFRVTPQIACPIDEHRITALNQTQEWDK